MDGYEFVERSGVGFVCELIFLYRLHTAPNIMQWMAFISIGSARVDESKWIFSQFTDSVRAFNILNS
jgi:hypothetical protein